MLTSNIDGYVPLKFEPGRTYNVSCYNCYKNLESASNTVRNASSPSTSKQRNMDTVSSSTQKETVDTQSNDTSSMGAAAKRDAVKSLILSDESGNMMRRLNAMSSAYLNGKTQSTASLDFDLGPEPKKPPRKNAQKAKSVSNDSADGSGSFVDVTYAL